MFLTRRWYTVKSDCILAACQSLGLPLKKVKYLNSSATRGVLAYDNPTFILSLGNGYIESDILDLADKSALNIHLEKLPEYPGARSVIWRLYNSERSTAYTIHKMTPKIDHGWIYYSREVEIDFKNTLKETISHTLERVVQSLEQNIAQMMIDIDRCESDTNGNELKQRSMGRYYTTPTFTEFFKIWFNFRRLRNEHK